MKSSVPISALLHHKGTALWSIAPEATVFEAIKLMADKNIGSLLVISGDRLVGVFTERDYTRKIALQGKRSKETQVREILSGKIVSVTPHQTVEECMRLMTENRVRHLPVLENGKAIGVVSIGDLVNWTISAQDATIAQMEQYISGSVTA
ncbi:MAG TPA: CBS domain-containing protein [Candidatus Limnocylindrales bacterium]|nr:CBS domain-containing protein [Candidatus Limnocylindrales bacterium]